MPDTLADVSSLPATVSVLAASIGSRHGYAIDGDSVRLHADLILYDPSAISAREWALQLWACKNSFAGGPLVGVKTAEVWLGSLDDFSTSTSSFHATAAFQAPAGGGEFTMVLTLSAGRSGQFQEIHGFVNYPRPETFLMPRLRGKVGYDIDDKRIKIDVEAVENPRPPTNTSGTLALELWALSAPYQGGHFKGSPLAGAVLGSLAGQCEWNPSTFDLAFKPPADGTWHFVLMLREWTGTGYTTRDYTTFAQPLTFKSPIQASWSRPETKAPFATEASTIAAKPKKISKTAEKTNSTNDLVSINTASATELATVKGLTKPMITALIAARPFTSLDDLLEVKGLGSKTLAKIRPGIKV